MKKVLFVGKVTKGPDDCIQHHDQFQITPLTENHLPQIMELQQIIHEHLSHPDLMIPMSYEFVQEHIDLRGFVLGAFLEERLIAFRMVYFPRFDDLEFNMGRDIGLTEAQCSQVANLQMVCVHPDFRGNSLGATLNRLSLHHLKAEKGYEHVFASVSPYNIWNIRILFKSGFHIVTLKRKYGGKLRYVVYQNLSTPVTFVGHDFISADLADFDTQNRIFHTGHFGVALLEPSGENSGLKGLDYFS